MKRDHAWWGIEVYTSYFLTEWSNRQSHAVILRELFYFSHFFCSRADVGQMGIVIRSKDGDDVATHVTWVGQVNLKGWMPKMMVNKVTIGYPVSIYDDLNTVGIATCCTLFIHVIRRIV